MPQPEDLAGQLALATGEDDAVRLDRAVERLPVVAVRQLRRGDRLRGEARVGEQLEAERLEAGPRRRGARLVAGEDRVLALGLHQAETLVDLVDDRDRRGEGRLAGRGRLAVGPDVEIEA